MFFDWRPSPVCCLYLIQLLYYIRMYECNCHYLLLALRTLLLNKCTTITKIKWNFEWWKNCHEMLQNTSFLSLPITQLSQSQIYFLSYYLCCFKFRYFYSIFNHDFGKKLWFHSCKHHSIEERGFHVRNPVFDFRVAIELNCIRLLSRYVEECIMPRRYRF
jgi:hypothetical protein